MFAAGASEAMLEFAGLSINRIDQLLILASGRGIAAFVEVLLFAHAVQKMIEESGRYRDGFLPWDSIVTVTHGRTE